MLAIGLGSDRAHLLTHAYSKADPEPHSLEPIVGYSPDKRKNMILMG